MRPLAAIVLGISVALAGCTGPAGADGPRAGGGAPTPGASTTTEIPATPADGQRTLVSGLDVPWDLAALPDESLLLTLRDRAEVIRILRGEQPRLVAQLPDVVPGGEGGLLGIALSPDFASDQLLYLYYTAAEDNRVVRLPLHRHGASPSRPRSSPGSRERRTTTAGACASDRTATSTSAPGDAGRTENAQDRNSLGGKILRVAADGSDPRRQPVRQRRLQLRPPQRAGHRLGRPGRLYASEFGQNTWDELNLIERGGELRLARRRKGETDAARPDHPARWSGAPRRRPPAGSP